MPLGEIPIERGHQREVPLRNRYFTTISWSGERTVADRHRLAAYHNKHCWRAFQWYQHRWPWTTLNRQNRCFTEFFAISGCDTHTICDTRMNCAEIIGDRLRQPGCEIVSIKRRFQRCKALPPRCRESSVLVHQILVPLENARFLLLLTNLVRERLQIGTDYLLIIQELWRPFRGYQHRWS